MLTPFVPFRLLRGAAGGEAGVDRVHAAVLLVFCLLGMLIFMDIGSIRIFPVVVYLLLCLLAVHAAVLEPSAWRELAHGLEAPTLNLQPSKQIKSLRIKDAPFRSVSAALADANPTP